MVSLELVNGSTVTVPGDDPADVMTWLRSGDGIVEDVNGNRVYVQPSHVVQAYAVPERDPSE